MKSNTIIEEGDPVALEAEMDALEEEEVPSQEVEEVPSRAEEASRNHEALLRVVEVACQAWGVFHPWREGASGGSQGDLEAVGGGA